MSAPFYSESLAKRIATLAMNRLVLCILSAFVLVLFFAVSTYDPDSNFGLPLAIGITAAAGSFRHRQTSPLAFYDEPFNLSLNASRRAYATTLYDEGYVPGALLLGHSLRFHGMLKPDVAQHMVLLHLPDRISNESLGLLRETGWETIEVERIPHPKGKAPSLIYIDQYTKLRLFEMEEFEQIFYIDADALVVKPFPEIWSFPTPFAASRDVRKGHGWLSTINAGTFLLKPSQRLLSHMLQVAPYLKYESKFAEQALLNVYWERDITILPYLYNAQLDIKRVSRDAWNSLKDRMRIIHYTGVKPWQCKGKTDLPTERQIWLDAWRNMMEEKQRSNHPNLKRVTELMDNYCFHSKLTGMD
ncbi:hypothetical protein FS842_004046 [Serendipita sp. 407]|nr:hypothetical protein FS842_004046 [Serendipita sp. 407]